MGEIENDVVSAFLFIRVAATHGIEVHSRNTHNRSFRDHRGALSEDQGSMCNEIMYFGHFQVESGCLQLLRKVPFAGNKHPAITAEFPDGPDLVGGHES